MATRFPVTITTAEELRVLVLPRDERVSARIPEGEIG